LRRSFPIAAAVLIQIVTL